MRSVSAVLLVLALVIAGCSSGGDADEQETETAPTPAPTEQADAEESATSDPAAVARLADAVEATIAEGSARFTMSVGGGTEGGGEQLAEGVEDFETQRRQITFSGPQGELDAVVDGSETYLRVPFLEGASWVRVDFADLGGGSLGGPVGLPLQDPGGAIELIDGTSGQVRELGEEDAEGVATTRYAVTVDLVAVADQADALAGGDVAAAMAETGARELAMNVWVDDDDLIRRVAYTLDADPTEVSAGDATFSAGGPVTATFAYRDFGTDAEVAVPSDGEVLDIDEDAIRDGVEGLGEGLGDLGGR